MCPKNMPIFAGFFSSRRQQYFFWFFFFEITITLWSQIMTKLIMVFIVIDTLNMKIVYDGHHDHDDGI